MKFNPDALRLARNRAGLSKYSLANEAGLSLDAVYRIEDGRTKNPRFETLQRLADATGVDVSFLFVATLPPVESEAV